MDLLEYQQENANVILLEYVVDLIAAHTLDKCQQATEELPGTLQWLGCCVLAKKAQLCTNKVTYLWYCLEGGNSSLFQSRI